ncbi:MAG: PIN domain-containing protein [archaeon GB-1867-005]|nr:PIN domain-containing protein [Candidatus Culexmicrobium cathedralense]
MTAIIDTGIFFAYYSLRDVHHLDSLAILVHALEGKWGKPYITNHILDETLTILKYRISPTTAKAFAEALIESKAIQVVHVDEEMERKALELFKQNINRKGFSYTDATTAATLRELNIKTLLTYDARSFQNLVESIIGSNYWQTLPKAEKQRILELAEKHAGGMVNVKKESEEL